MHTESSEAPLMQRRQTYKDYRQQKERQSSESASGNHQNVEFRKQQHWPFLLWVYLKFLGLYHDAPLVTVRRCSQCKEIGHEHFTTMTSFQMHHCDICESFLWDYDGMVSYITDKEIGASRLNHKYSFVVSNIWLFILFSSTVTLFAVDLIRYEHKKDDLVEAVSTLCIQGLLTIPVISAIACNLHTTFPHWAPGKWANAISPTFLVQRLRCVDMRRTRMAGYVLFFTSVFFITIQCTRIAQDVFAYGKDSGHYYTPIDYFLIVVGTFNFAGLAYIVYLLRRSFEKEVRLVCMFINEHIEQVDMCRKRLAEAFDTFHDFREFTSGWMSMNVIFGIVSFLLEVHVWITSSSAEMPYYRYERLIFLLSCFVVPILAIGNVSVDYLWFRLVRQISRRRTSDKEFNWDKVMQFLQEQRPGNRPWQSVMAFILSIVAVFAAIQFRILSSKAINSATHFQPLNVTEVFQ